MRTDVVRWDQDDQWYRVLALRPGQVLQGQYTIEKIVGLGGHGSVWKAHDKHLKRNVAIKRLLRKGAEEDERAIKAVREEAEKNALVSHPNVMSVYGIIEVEDELLIVTEYVDGKSLHEHLRELALSGQSISFEQGVEWLRQILEGVGAAHAEQVCHRDLSPMNILLSSGGVPKITDFGIAKIINSTGGCRSNAYVTIPRRHREPRLHVLPHKSLVALIFHT